MRMGFGLTLEQNQKLVMTPELRQAIKILQLSTVELTEYLQQEVLENPVLEFKEEIDDRESNGAETEETEEQNETFEVDWLEYFQDGTDLGYMRVPKEERSYYSPEQYLSEMPSLPEYLTLQLHLSTSNKRQRAIGEFLIGNIDEHGYLTTSVEEAGAHMQMPVRSVERVLRLIQGFDPPGVGARNLRECLIIQVRLRGVADPWVERIVLHHLEDLAAGRMGKIARAQNISVQDVQEAADLIKSLDPKPGRKFANSQEVRYIVPDVVIERVNGEFVVLINDISTPRLGLNPLYRSLLRQDSQCDPETRKFIQSKLNAAAWIIKSIEQRRVTLYRVVNCIVNFQRAFLEKGVKMLKPLNLRQVAEVVGVHESTVSRAISNKYVQTTQGVFELKFFFASGVENGNGSGTASESVKKIIQEYIAAEDPKNPLTDQQITGRLNLQGIHISRRTVAKYRDEMGVQATPRRKRY
ncbi:MAG: RNA polymerase factor sigma-54 [Bacillota bacterium]